MILLNHINPASKGCFGVFGFVITVRQVLHQTSRVLKEA